MEELLVGLFVITFVGTIWWLSHYFSDMNVFVRKLKHMPAGSIMTCKDDDVVRLTGKAETHLQTLVAPLSKRKCLYYQMNIQQKVDKSWRSIVYDEKGVNFFISDKRERALVSTYKTEALLVQDIHFKSGFLNDATENMNELLKRYGKSSENFFGFNKSIRYHEAIIEEGDTILVGGKAKWKPGKEIGLPEEQGTVLYIKAADTNNAVYLSNDPEIMNRIDS